jgi:4'-phosphopantetheinyl transferase
MEIEPFCDENLMDELIRGITSIRKERILRYRNILDKKLGVFAEVLVRCAICARSGVGYRKIDFGVSHTGKPYLMGFPQYEFSMTHTHHAVAAAVSEQPVGVDVERIKGVDLSIANRIFSDREVALLNTAPDKRFSFLEIWTKKEALIKKRGTGLTNDLSSFDTTSSSPCERFVSYETGDYIISLCSDAENHEVEFLTISEMELIDRWLHLMA